MVNYREEATELVKAILAANEFEEAVVLLEDYLIDQNTTYEGMLHKLGFDLETARAK